MAAGAPKRVTRERDDRSRGGRCVWLGVACRANPNRTGTLALELSVRLVQDILKTPGR